MAFIENWMLLNDASRPVNSGVGPDMNVTFTRTAERHYPVSVEGPGVVSSWMEPAPGYDARLPHDMAHFEVENELGITGEYSASLLLGGMRARFIQQMSKHAVR